MSPVIGFQEQKKVEVFYPRQLMTVEPSGIYRLEVQQETIAEQSKLKNTHTPPKEGKYEKGLKMLCGLSQEQSLKTKICSTYQKSVSI